MNCARTEELIPRYLDNDLSDDERRLVAAHLAECPECLASIEAYTALEESLVRLAAAVPSWRTAEARLERSAGLSRRRSVAALVYNPSVFLGLAFIALGIVLFTRGASLLPAARTFSSGLSAALGDYDQLVSRLLGTAAGASVITLLTVYLLLVLALFYAGRELVLGFGRK